MLDALHLVINPAETYNTDVPSCRSVCRGAHFLLKQLSGVDDLVCTAEHV